MYSQSSVTRFDHFVAWLLALGLYRLARGLMLVLLLTSAACFHSHKAALARVPLVAAGERPLARRLAGADLVVTATLAKTGTVLWKFYCGAGVNAAPSVYELDGEQFIAVAAGGNFQISYPLGNSVFIFGLPKAGM